jgi:hypothetical protein
MPLLPGLALKAGLRSTGRIILRLDGFALNAGLRPAGLGKPSQLNFGSRSRPRFGIIARRFPHFRILPMLCSSPPGIPAGKPPQLL